MFHGYWPRDELREQPKPVACSVSCASTRSCVLSAHFVGNVSFVPHRLILNKSGASVLGERRGNLVLTPIRWISLRLGHPLMDVLKSGQVNLEQQSYPERSLGLVV